MTVARLSAAVGAPSLEAALTSLRARGLRISAARRLVLEALYAAEGPVPADEIARGLGGRVPPSDLASAYRNLETLEAAGIVQHVHLGHGPGLYTLAGGATPEYLSCERCGTHVAVAPQALDPVRTYVERTFGYAASWAHFPIVGLCASCANAAIAEDEGAGRSPSTAVPGCNANHDDTIRSPATSGTGT
jgi:Fur family transcriptional regulator, ferric uptake regulator